MIAKKSIETGEDCDSIPESMRQYLAMQFDPNKPGGRDLFGRAGALGGYGPTGALPGDGSHSGKIGKQSSRRAHLNKLDCLLG
jgi:hypothetical protein